MKILKEIASNLTLTGLKNNLFSLIPLLSLLVCYWVIAQVHDRIVNPAFAFYSFDIDGIPYPEKTSSCKRRDPTSQKQISTSKTVGADFSIAPISSWTVSLGMFCVAMIVVASMSIYCICSCDNLSFFSRAIIITLLVLLVLGYAISKQYGYRFETEPTNFIVEVLDRKLDSTSIRHLMQQVNIALFSVNFLIVVAVSTLLVVNHEENNDEARLKLIARNRSLTRALLYATAAYFFLGVIEMGLLYSAVTPWMDKENSEKMRELAIACSSGAGAKMSIALFCVFFPSEFYFNREISKWINSRSPRDLESQKKWLHSHDLELPTYTRGLLNVFAAVSPVLTGLQLQPLLELFGD